MKSSLKSQPAQKILLSGVFGPFGVDDQFGRKENIMELFHNQVTREQGLSSFRFHHRSFGLYFLAENIEGDVTVLDFPSKGAFRKEVRKGYDLIGISFITPNFLKTREMCRIIRELSPDTFILLGGHGTAVEGVEDLLDCDHIIRGEGMLSVIARRAVNETERARALELERNIKARLGHSTGRRMAGLAARALASAWALRVKFLGDGLQPKTIRTHYSADELRVPRAIPEIGKHVEVEILQRANTG